MKIIYQHDTWTPENPQNRIVITIWDTFFIPEFTRQGYNGGWNLQLGWIELSYHNLPF